MEKVSLAKIENLIYVIRGQKVMLDSDLADLYEVETRIFNQAIKRNLDRFPKDFMFELTNEETHELYIYLGIKVKHGGRRKNPFVFTENGVAMISGVLNSKRAVQINIAIMRTFTKLRNFLKVENAIASRLDSTILKKVQTNYSKLYFNDLMRLKTNKTRISAANGRKLALRIVKT